MADRIALMREGHIVQTGAPADLYCRPVEPFVVRFFGEVNEFEGVVHDGMVATPAGTIPAGPLPQGAAVTVLVRPEALRVAGPQATGDANPGPAARVIAARLLGRASLLHLEVRNAAGAPRHLHARVPGVCLPGSGQVVGLALDASQVFVFPREPAASA